MEVRRDEETKRHEDDHRLARQHGKKRRNRDKDAIEAAAKTVHVSGTGTLSAAEIETETSMDSHYVNVVIDAVTEAATVRTTAATGNLIGGDLTQVEATQRE